MSSKSAIDCEAAVYIHTNMHLSVYILSLTDTHKHTHTHTEFPQRAVLVISGMLVIPVMAVTPDL